MSLEQLQERYTFGREELRYYSAELKRADVTAVERATIRHIRAELVRSLSQLSARIDERKRAN